MDNTKFLQYHRDKKCMLGYHIDMNGYNEYWYNDTKNILRNYEIVVIDVLIIPMVSGHSTGIDFLREFCDTMTVGNRVVVFDNEDFIRNLDAIESRLYYDTCVHMMDEILTQVGFDPLNTYGYTYNYKDVYVYTRAKLGREVFHKVETYFYGIEDEE